MIYCTIHTILYYIVLYYTLLLWYNPYLPLRIGPKAIVFSFSDLEYKPFVFSCASVLFDGPECFHILRGSIGFPI